MPEQNQNLWTPWRMTYLENVERDNRETGCFLCRYRDTPAADAENGVLWRSSRTLVVLNRYPYTNGHLLVAPADHVGELDDLPEATLFETVVRIREARRVLRDTVAAHGFNIGINLGQSAGAGLPDHLHWHVVPRWSGDTNFMASVSDVRLIPQTLETLRERFLECAARLRLGPVAG